MRDDSGRPSHPVVGKRVRWVSCLTGEPNRPAKDRSFPDKKAVVALASITASPSHRFPRRLQFNGSRFSEAFLSWPSLCGVTSTCELQSTTLKDGRIVNVIDTPGLFDSSDESEATGKEIVRCVNLAKDVFTGGDDLESCGQTLKDFIGHTLQDPCFLITRLKMRPNELSRCKDFYILWILSLQAMEGALRLQHKEEELARATEMVEHKLNQTVEKLLRASLERAKKDAEEFRTCADDKKTCVYL
ncbi:hypothetical protein OPV22_031300 [Ensete ventricosum]|uniref:AIG1-type G domain-containing protein n=1 Tax=Ensete ventricosum TaxID=4639 RepID=A0AAV8PNQ8_ENSVE|nr:hypothetical protein OPV22_031300 [Ensete ventricosum]